MPIDSQSLYFTVVFIVYGSFLWASDAANDAKRELRTQRAIRRVLGF